MCRLDICKSFNFYGRKLRELYIRIKSFGSEIIRNHF